MLIFKFYYSLFTNNIKIYIIRNINFYKLFSLTIYFHSLLITLEKIINIDN
ncbi:hypothetical protein NPD8_4274 (plasmid) [Clostridium botulinum]|uniref:Uncharacterized protein n=1 Tax=Clostridium botulinum TaxID=1491 RepID=A0A1L7JN25_CLOBO|nr:hypothetical protein NPD8_4274 [Clostridium botulinum]